MVIRSYNRLPALLELLERVLRQKHDSFEVVVVEQTQSPEPRDAEALSQLEQDARLRVLRFEPLGGPRARNEGVRAARSDLVILIDDDDLPVDDTWIAEHEAHFEDPSVVGVTARHVRAVGELCPYPGWGVVKRRVMSYNALGIPYTFARFDQDTGPVRWLHGTNASFRRERILAAGLWDEHVRNQDEHSLAFKLQKTLASHEQLVFRARPLVLRRMDVPGGMGKREATVERELRNQLQYIHRILGRYKRQQLRVLYPVYLGIAVSKAALWVWQDAEEGHASLSFRLRQTARLLGVFPRELAMERRANAALDR